MCRTGWVAPTSKRQTHSGKDEMVCRVWIASHRGVESKPAIDCSFIMIVYGFNYAIVNIPILEARLPGS